MRNRTVFAGSYALSGCVKKLCEGHGSRDHQPIKGYLEPSLSRSDYVRGNHSSLAGEIAKDLLGGLYLQAPGKRPKTDASRRRQRKVRLAVAAAADEAESETDPELPELVSNSDADEKMTECSSDFDEPEAQGVLATTKQEAKAKTSPSLLLERPPAQDA